MNLTEYKNIINETAVYPKEVNNFGLAYAVIGLFDEFSEYMEKESSVNFFNDESVKELDKERFDTIWYIAALCKEADISFENVIEKGMKFTDESISQEEFFNKHNPFKILGMVKKFYRDNKELDKEKLEHLLIVFTGTVLENMTKEQVEEGLKNNYEKLMSRKQRDLLKGDGDNR